MEIQPLYGDQPLALNRVTVRVNPEDAKRFYGLVERSRSSVLQVTNSAEFELAKQCAGQLKGITNEIAKAQKGAKEPFKAVVDAINTKAKEISETVETEHKRVLTLLGGYVTRLEAEREAEKRKQAEAARRQQEAHDLEIARARAAQAQAELEARQAADEAARLRARLEAQAHAAAAEQEQMAKEMDAEIAKLGAEQLAKGLVQGGRVNHRFSFTLRDLGAVIRAGRLGLLRWELDHLACQDDCQAQLRADPDCEPWLPGIEVTRHLNVSVRAK